MKDVKYINLTETELINNIKNEGCSDSITELMRRHLNIVHSVMHKFCNKNKHIDLKELLEDKYLIFNNAVNTYKFDKKTKFSSWLYCCSRFHCLNSNKDIDKTINLESHDIDLINNRYYIDGYCSNTENRNYIFNILNQIPDNRIKQIFKMRYYDGRGHKLKTWAEISNVLKLSQTRVIELHEKGRLILNKKITNNNWSDKL